MTQLFAQRRVRGTEVPLLPKPYVRVSPHTAFPSSLAEGHLYRLNRGKSFILVTGSQELICYCDASVLIMKPGFVFVGHGVYPFHGNAPQMPDLALVIAV